MVINFEYSPVCTHDNWTCSPAGDGEGQSAPRDTHKQLDFFHYILSQPPTVATSDLLLPLHQAARTAAPKLVTQHWSQRGTNPRHPPTTVNDRQHWLIGNFSASLVMHVTLTPRRCLAAKCNSQHTATSFILGFLIPN